MGRPGRVTATDVASLAGVSTSTVSLVINGKAAGRVADATQARVHDAVARLGYRIDAVARSLATGRTHTVALTVPDLVNPYYSQVTMGVAEGLTGYQLMLLVSNTDDERFAADVEEMLAERVDGVLADAPGARLLAGLDVSCPVVLFDRPAPEAPFPHVDFDLAAGVRTLASHLVGLGHRNLGYLDASRKAPTFTARRQLLTRRMRAAAPSVTVTTGRSATTMQAAEVEFSRLWPAWHDAGVSCVVCATDIQAYGVLTAAERLGIDVPRQLSVAAFDDLPYSRITAPGGLTTVRLPGHELGVRSAELLRALIDGDPPDSTDVRLPCELQVRGTTTRAH